jgi:hypothetical protein
MTLENEIAQLRKKLQEHENRISLLESTVGKTPNTGSSGKSGTEGVLMELRASGFFDNGRTISEIRDAMHAKGRIVKITDLPPYLLKSVRNGTLRRERKLLGKRETWVYFA